MENDIVTSKLTSSELKEILAGVPMSYYMNSCTAGLGGSQRGAGLILGYLLV